MISGQSRTVKSWDEGWALLSLGTPLFPVGALLVSLSKPKPSSSVQYAFSLLAVVAMSHRWFDILIHPEEVLRVVLVFEFDQSLVIGAKGRGRRFGIAGKVGIEAAG